MKLFSAAGVAVILYASTNVDALFVLLMFFTNRKIHPRSIVAGEFLGMWTIVAVSLVCASASVLVPANDLAWLGLVPIGLGMWQLSKHFRTPHVAIDVPAKHNRRDLLFVALITLSHSADNIAVYVPLFATSSMHLIALAVGVFTLMTAVWCWLAHTLTRHPMAAKHVGNVAGWVTPLVLIALGVWIFSGLFRQS